MHVRAIMDGLRRIVRALRISARAAEGRLLVAAILKGRRDPNALHISAAAVLGYSVVHGAAFVLFGILAAVLAARGHVERCGRDAVWTAATIPR